MKKIISLTMVFTLLTLIVMSLSSCGNRDSFDSFEIYKNNGTKIEAKICNVKNDYNGIVTIISDDGYYESGVILNNLAKKYDVNVTVAGVVEIINRKIQEWHKIENEGHVDIVNHTYSHRRVTPKDKVPNKLVRHEYICSKKYYEENFKTPAFAFVAPENTTTGYGFSVLKEAGYLAARLGVRGENPIEEKIVYGTDPGEWLNLKMRSLYDVDDTEGRNKWVDSAIDNRTWIIEMWHDISPKGDVGFQGISTKKASEHISYISKRQKEKKVWAASFTQAISYIYQRDNGLLEAYVNGESIAVKYNRLNSNLPWDLFNVPVTVKLEVPKNLKIKHACSENKKISFTIENGFIMFDIPTDETTIYLN